jgi:rhodanese-related sulfurtransferase
MPGADAPCRWCAARVRSTTRRGRKPRGMSLAHHRTCSVTPGIRPGALWRVKSMRKAAVCLALIVGIIGMATSCSTPAAAPSGDKQATVVVLEPGDALSLIEKNRGNDRFVILDVRTPEEFDSGHIGDAINIDYHSPLFRSHLDRLDKKKTYLVYCRTGRRSGAAVQTMRELGFTSLYRISGDMVRWQSMKLPVVK